MILGQTLDLVGLDLIDEVFSHDQLYVGFSRVRSWETIKIQLSDEQRNRTRNVVWKDALSN